MTIRERLAPWREAARIVFVLVGWLAIVAALQPWGQHQHGVAENDGQREHLDKKPNDLPYTEDYRFGWPGSPLFTYHAHSQLEKIGDSKHEPKVSQNFDFNILSLSFLFLISGIVSLVVSRWVPTLLSIQKQPRAGEQAAGVDRPKQNRARRMKYPFLTYLLVGAVVVCLWGGVGYMNIRRFPNYEQAGVFGDSFGMVNSLFSGLAFGCIALTLYYQTKELSLQRRELRQSRIEMKKSADAQKEIVKLSAASTLLEHYLEQYQLSGQQQEDGLFDMALQLGEVQAKATLKGKILTCTAIVEKQFFTATGTQVSPSSDVQFDKLRARLWADRLYAAPSDMAKGATAGTLMAPAFDFLDRAEKGAGELNNCLVLLLTWVDAPTKFVANTPAQTEAILGELSDLRVKMRQEQPKRHITQEEIDSSLLLSGRCRTLAEAIIAAIGAV